MIRCITLTLAALFAAGAVCAQGLDGRLKKIADTKTISVAYRNDATPFAFVDDKKQPIGFSIDLCKRVINSIERQINVQNLKVNWVPVTVQTRFDAVVKGQADMECGSSTVTLSRLKQVDFSSFIFVQTTSLIVNAASGLRSLSDMSGKKIGVIAGTTNEQAVNEQIKTPPDQRDRGSLQERRRGGRRARRRQDRRLCQRPVAAAGRGEQVQGPEEIRHAAGRTLVRALRHHAAARRRLRSASPSTPGCRKSTGSGEIGEIYNRWFASLGSPPTAVQMVYVFGAIPE